MLKLHNLTHVRVFTVASTLPERVVCQKERLFEFSYLALKKWRRSDTSTNPGTMFREGSRKSEPAKGESREYRHRRSVWALKQPHITLAIHRWLSQIQRKMETILALIVGGRVAQKENSSRMRDCI